ncbi:hypothetical protein [Pleomorphomonas sp. NRK KF1]|uniref:hypothetical protein n=1 Tax=Pleomorphomonas sp. NRK KF1 TaxID=2943000 RepID=UPI002043B9F1|nr:hypothetical protein [Pleomorphomonas sp. NRK KF1]MCM5552393.1 hypothetical protein [Pleomorphomonas sp. NRK KF1]
MNDLETADWATCAPLLSGPALRSFLAAPHPGVGIDVIARQWRWTTISLSLAGDFSSLEGHDVARRIRGALWPVLKRHASKEAIDGLPCPRQPLSMLDLLWNDHGKVTRARDVPRPFVTRAQVDRDGGSSRAVFQIILFGIACCFADRLMPLLLEVFAYGVGRDGERPNWQVLDQQVETESEVAAVVDARIDQVLMVLKSPIILKRDGTAASDWHGLLPGLVDRIEGLALWHGLRLDCDFTAVKNDARATRVYDGGIVETRWERRSTRHWHEIPMQDRRGHLVLEGPLDRLVPYLLIGETAQIGHDTRHGHGWYGVELWGDDAG